MTERFSSGASFHTEVVMRPLVLLLARCALLFLFGCQSGPGPSSVLDVQPAVGAGARVFASPQDGVGAAARIELGKCGFRTGKAAEPPPVVAPSCATAPSPGEACPVSQPDPLRAPEAPVPATGSQP